LFSEQEETTVRHYRLAGIGLAAAVAGCLFCTSPASAQPKPGYSPSSTHIFPAGGRRGTVVKVLVGAECIPPGTQFHLIGEGVSAPAVLGAEVRAAGERSPRREPTEIPITYPREWPSEMTISKGAARGPIYWRLSCAQGGTGSRPFIVGDLPEFIETESNSTPAKAEPLTLPITVNGRIHGERDVDYFRFAAKAGDVVVCEVLAGRLGSRLDPVVELLGSDGQPVDAQEVRIGTDPVLAMRVETAGEYLLRIANVTVYGGPSYVYRVNISNRPYVRFAFPAGGQVGTERDVDFTVLTGTGTPKILRRRVSFPGKVNDRWSHRLLSQTGPGDKQSPEFVSTTLVVDDLTNIVEQEPNDTAATAGRLKLPVSVDGRTLTATDEDWFRFTAEKGEAISIRCRSFPRGTAALPTLLLTTTEGTRLAQSRSVDSPDGNCGIQWSAPSSATYLLRVRDMQFGARGGADFIYRLSIRRSDPDFSLTLSSDALDVVQGGTAKLPIKLQRYGGLKGPVKLTFVGLPEGVTVDTTEIPAGKNEVSATITAGEDVLLHSFALKLTGRADANGQTIERTAQAAHLGIDAERVAVGRATLDRLQITVRHKQLFKLFCSEAYLYAYRGSIFPYQMEIERLNGFEGEIHLQQGDRQNRDLDGVQLLNATIPAGQTQTILPIYLPETMHINVQSQSQLYSQAYATFTDKAGRKQAVLILAEKRNMLRTLPPVVKLKAVTGEIVVKPGEQVVCRFLLQRTSNFPGPMQLRLRKPAKPQGLTVDGIGINTGQTEVALPIKISAGHPPGTKQTLTFRATGDLGKHVIVTEATITIRIE
jgi:hypothetical protein